MIDFIINILTPIFVSMGASAADVGNYIRSVSGYIYAILAALLVMAVVMVAAQFVVKKGARHVVRWSAGLAWVLVVLLCVNLICYGPLYATVLGWASTNPVYSGTGSANSGDGAAPAARSFLPRAAGMAALGKILNGTVNPSGRTVDTYLKDLTKAPTWNHSGNSGNHLFTDVDDLLKQVIRSDNTFQGVFPFVDYVEGIYMGYKFYETAAEEGLISYDDYVQYPFGYGLSYTSFTQEITDFKQDSNTVTVEVAVTNTGSVAGKDVVELYSTPPYNNGGIEKSSVNLVDFGKTQLLEPGASEKITLSVAMEDLASYDSSCIKTENGGYILEAGTYTLSIRSDSHTVLDERTFALSSDVDYSKDGHASH